MTQSKARNGENNYDLTEAEWAIIKAVWEHEPCAAPTIQEVLKAEKQWSYSTVKTLMDRMVDKGLLVTEKIRNLILYRSSITQAQAQRSEVFKTIKRAFNGALTPMMQFLLNNEKLSDKDLADLESLVKAERIKRKS
jgi:predicted transcriptional regulator